MKNYREIQIPKRSGGTRTIVVPSAEIKRRLRELLPVLHREVRRTCDPEVVHGFAERRSVVTAALRHVGYQYTVTMDLADFFDRVTPSTPGTWGAQWPEMYYGTRLRRWTGRLPRRSGARWPEMYYGKRAAQGLPTSPLIANLAMSGPDETLKALAPVYTRYGDDLTWSTNDPDDVQRILTEAPEILTRAGFPVNHRKTRVQYASAGRRIICGVAVDDEGIHPTRASKRRLRAARHNARRGKVSHFPSRQWTRYVKMCRRDGKPIRKRAWLRKWLWQKVKGLEQWCQLKPPNGGKRTALRISETMPAEEALAELGRRW